MNDMIDEPTIGRRAASGWLACAVPAALAGCAGGLLPKPAPAPARFTLDDGSAMVDATVAVSAAAPTLLLSVPRAAPGFDSRRLVYLRRPAELEAFAFHEWVDTPAHMLAPLLQRALQGSGAFRAVLLAPSAASGTLRLETELVRLQHDFGSPPSRVRLTLRAVLLDSASRQVLAAREFDDSEPATSEDPVAGVAAARLLSQRVLAALAVSVAAAARR